MQAFEFIQTAYRILQFGKLKENWDSYGALPIDKPNLNLAFRFLIKLEHEFWTNKIQLPKPQVYPSPEGYVVFEFENEKGFALELNVLYKDGKKYIEWLLCLSNDQEDWVEVSKELDIMDLSKYEAIQELIKDVQNREKN
jgi:hypothetical protein